MQAGGNMINQIGKKLKLSYVIAFLCTLFALMVFLVTEPSLSGAGDMNIARYLGSAQIAPGFFFISPVLAYILRFLNTIYTANWWAVFSITVMFGGLYVFLWFVNKRAYLQELPHLLFADGVFVLFYWELMLKHEINFTQTTVIAAIAAVLLVLDCCYEKDNIKPADRKTVIVKICMGVCLLFLSGSIRWKALAMMVPFSLMCLFYFFVFPCTSRNLIESLRLSVKKKKNTLLLAGMVVTVVVLSYGLHKMYGIVNPTLGEYVKANALREEICDYRDRYPSYDRNTEMYQDLGIQQTWINMVYAFMTGDEKHFSSDDLSKMAAIRQSSHSTIKDFTNSLKGHALMWISLAVLLVFLTLFRGGKQFYIPLLGCILAFWVCGFYFIAIGRIAWRVTNGCVLASALSYIAMMLYTVSCAEDRKSGLIERIGLLIMTALFFVTGCAAVRIEKEFSLPRAAVTDEERAGMLDYMDGNNDIIYLDLEDMLNFYNAHNLWAAHEPEYLDNNVSLVAHFILGEKEILAAAGIDDLIGDMLVKPNIYVRYSSPGGNGIFLGYLKDYYDACISASVVDRYGSSRFLRYSRPIDTGKDIRKNIMVIDTFFEIVDEFPDDESIITAIQVNCHMNPDDSIHYQDYYLNITDHATGLLYSYGLKSEEFGCSGKVLWMNGTWNQDDISVALIGLSLDGSYETIADVTETFCTSLRDADRFSGAKH